MKFYYQPLLGCCQCNSTRELYNYQPLLGCSQCNSTRELYYQLLLGWSSYSWAETRATLEPGYVWLYIMTGMIQQCTDQPLSRVVAPPAREILHRRGQSINGRSLKADPMFLCLSRQLVYPSQTTCWSNWGFLWKRERIMRIIFEWMKIVIEWEWNEIIFEWMKIIWMRMKWNEIIFEWMKIIWMRMKWNEN